MRLGFHRDAIVVPLMWRASKSPNSRPLNCNCHDWQSRDFAAKVQFCTNKRWQLPTAVPPIVWRRQEFRNAHKSLHRTQLSTRGCKRKILLQIMSKNRTTPQTNVARSQDHPVNIIIHFSVPFDHNQPHIQCRGSTRSFIGTCIGLSSFRTTTTTSPLIWVVSSPLLHFLLLGVVLL